MQELRLLQVGHILLLALHGTCLLACWQPCMPCIALPLLCSKGSQVKLTQLSCNANLHNMQNKVWSTSAPVAVRPRKACLCRDNVSEVLFSSFVICHFEPLSYADWPVCLQAICYVFCMQIPIRPMSWSVWSGV